MKSKDFDQSHTAWQPAFAALLMLATIGAPHAPAAESPAVRPDLTGRVADKNGQAVANASVFIYTAGPRVGASPI